MNGELLRIVDTLHRDKDIDKEVLFEAIESALLTAARKKFGEENALTLRINRDTGHVVSYDAEGNELHLQDMGRIAAQTAKQVILQKIREAERDVIFTEYDRYQRSIVPGQVVRLEGTTLVVRLGTRDRGPEAFLPKHEQVRGEQYRIGDQVLCYVVEVRKNGPKVRIMLSRSHPDLIRRLFEREVPEIADGIVEVKKLVREAGYKTKVAVVSLDSKVDPVGACIGIRGARIKTIIDELGGERIDIIPYSDQPATLIMNALKPAEINRIDLFPENGKALVIVDEDQLSLAIGKKGANVRLAAKLCGWDIDIMTEEEAKQKGLLEENPAPGSEGELSYVEDRGDAASVTESGRLASGAMPEAPAADPDAPAASGGAPADGGADGGAMEPPPAPASKRTQPPRVPVAPLPPPDAEAGGAAPAAGS
ncbi:MAG TPA: transcription termination factor NusA [Planctomycetota bacterium]|nr:transcription termination factor NusA [Planctomycetota bacterium]